MQQAFKPLAYTSGRVVVSWGFAGNIPKKFWEWILKKIKTKQRKLIFSFFDCLLQRGLVQVQKHYKC